MDNNQKIEISKLIAGSFEMQAKPITTATIDMIIKTFELFDYNTLKTAINKVLMKGQLVTTATVLPIIQKCDGRMESDEAWSRSLLAFDESATIVWTDEMSAAWGAAEDLYNNGDRVGARMAFKQCYERLVEENRLNRVPLNYWISYGTDVQRRIGAIDKARLEGLISNDKANSLIESQNTEITNNVLRLERFIKK